MSSRTETVEQLVRRLVEIALEQDADITRLQAEVERLREALVKADEAIIRQQQDLEQAASAAADVPRLTAEVERLRAAQQWQPTHRHVKRGSTYQVIGTAELQAADLVKEGAWLTIYRGEDQTLWARPMFEFSDGRFEKLPQPPSQEQTYEG